MKNFIPTLICLITIAFVAVKDSTYNVAPPFSWYDVLGCLAIAFFVATFIWGLVQQSNDNDTRRVVERQQKIAFGAGHKVTPPMQSDPHKPLDPPKRK